MRTYVRPSGDSPLNSLISSSSTIPHASSSSTMPPPLISPSLPPPPPTSARPPPVQPPLRGRRPSLLLYPLPLLSPFLCPLQSEPPPLPSCASSRRQRRAPEERAAGLRSLCLPPPFTAPAPALLFEDGAYARRRSRLMEGRRASLPPPARSLPVRRRPRLRPLAARVRFGDSRWGS